MTRRDTAGFGLYPYGDSAGALCDNAPHQAWNLTCCRGWHVAGLSGNSADRARGAACAGPLMRGKSRLHIPTTPARPGDVPDFSYLLTARAGATPRPPLDAPLASLTELASGLVRVLDDEHRAVGPWHEPLPTQTLHLALRHMLLTRCFDARMVRAHRQGAISFYIGSRGEEAISVAQGMALRLSLIHISEPTRPY